MAILKRVVVGGHVAVANALRKKLSLPPLSSRSAKHASDRERKGGNIRPGNIVWSTEEVKERSACKRTKNENQVQATALKANHEQARCAASIKPFGAGEMSAGAIRARLALTGTHDGADEDGGGKGKTGCSRDASDRHQFRRFVAGTKTLGGWTQL